MGAVSIALASLSARRALATATVFAFMLLTPAVSSMLENGAGALGRYAPLLSPIRVVAGVITWLFAVPPRPRRGPAPAFEALAGSVYGWAALAVVVLACVARVRA
jgi:hypothetical protein